MTDPLNDLTTDLIAARRTGTPLDATRYTLDTPEQAYAVQEALAAAADGRTGGMARHWKSGAPSREHNPTHAALPLPGVFTSPAEARSWPFIRPHIEAEIALRLGRSVSPAEAATLQLDAVAPLLDGMAVSTEVVDSRWQQFREAPALLKLADLQVHGALVLAAWQPLRAIDWATQGLTVTIAGQTHRFTGSLGVTDPLFVVPAWLRHLTRHGDTVPAGTVVTTGTWCGLLPAQRGDAVHVAFEGVGEASVQL